MNNITHLKKGARARKEKIGEIARLQLVLSDKDMKLSDFAEISGMADRSVKNMVHNNKQISPQVLRDLRLKMGVSVDWILSGEGDMYVGSNPEGQVLSGKPSPLIPYLDHIDEKNMADFWYLAAMTAEMSLMSAGAVPDSDYSVLDLYQLVQPIVVERYKQNKLDIVAFENGKK